MTGAAVLGRYLSGQITGQLFGRRRRHPEMPLGWRAVFFVLRACFAVAAVGLFTN